jgi:glutamine synthetase
VLNSSVNAYRRLDPNYEAPNKIRYSHSDRSSMVRLPIGNEHSTRIEVRSVAPDTNPYLLIYTLLRTGLEGEKEQKDKGKRVRTKTLPSNIYDAIRVFKASDFTTELLGQEAKERYLELKEAVANRSPKELGKTIKNSEVLYHHEVTNQYLWNKF